MDIQEIKAPTPDLDILKVFTVCKEKIVSQLEISKEFKITLSLKDSFL